MGLISCASPVSVLACPPQSSRLSPVGISGIRACERSGMNPCLEMLGMKHQVALRVPSPKSAAFRTGVSWRHALSSLSTTRQTDWVVQPCCLDWRFYLCFFHFLLLSPLLPAAITSGDSCRSILPLLFNSDILRLFRMPPTETRNEIHCSSACDSTPKANGRLQQGGPGQTETDVSANPSAE